MLSGLSIASVGGVRHDGVLVCRAVLENPHTGERRAFADLEALFGYLTKEVRQVSQVTPDAGQTQID